MKLSDIKTLPELATENNIVITTLQKRFEKQLKDLIDGEDYRRMGKGKHTLFSPQGVEKMIKNNPDLFKLPLQQQYRLDTGWKQKKKK